MTPSASGALLYPVDSVPPPARLLVAGLQHALAMFAGVVMVPLIVARACGFAAADSARLVNMAVLVSGLATLLQVVRVGPVGSGFLCVMGSSGLFIQPCIAAGKAGGLPLLFGMSLALSPVQALMSRTTRWLRHLSPPTVVGTIIVLIGFAVLPLSLNELAGGKGSAEFASARQIGVGAVTIGITLWAALSRWPPVRIGSLLVGVAAGTLLSAGLGTVNLAAATPAPWVALPVPLWAGLSFDVRYLLPFAMAYVITSIETYGDMVTLVEVCHTPAGADADRRISGGLLADAAGSALAGLFGTTPNTSYSGNIAIVKLTGVASRAVGVVTGLSLVVLSLFPKLSALIASLPSAVLGGSMVVATAMLLAVGMQVATRGGDSNRNLLVVGIAVTLGMGVTLTPQLAQALPPGLQPLAQNGVCVGTLCAMLLHRLLPRPEPTAA